MAKFSLRRYDTQAQVSVLLALVSLVGLAGLAFIVLQNLSLEDWLIYHGQRRPMLVKLATALTFLFASAAFGMGINSIGQRRNDKQPLSWAGFLLGAIVMCLTIAVFWLFRERGEAIYN